MRPKRLRLEKTTIRHLSETTLLRAVGGLPEFTEEEMSCETRARHCSGLCPPFSVGGTCQINVCG